MTIRDIDLNASQFEAGAKYRTNDGKLVTLKHVCVEEAPPRVNIADAGRGDTLVLRNGERFICTGDQSEGGSRCARGAKYRLWFHLDGTCPSCDDDYDVVELIKAPDPTISLEGLKVGDRFRVRNGDIFTCTRLDSCGSPIYAKSKNHGGIYFRWSGESNMDDRPEFEAIERLTPSILGQLREQLSKLDKAQVGRVVVSHQEWEELQKEVRFDKNGHIFVDGVRVLYTSLLNDVPPGRFDIQFKFR
jgi:hypothetical protein